jgi:uncharacterized membrane protein YhaH (DUF805 family)
MRWYFEVLKKYAAFAGRARRKEFWTFLLFHLLILSLLAIIDVATGAVDPSRRFGLLSSLYGLAGLIPLVAVLVRRLHDTNHSGWCSLMGLIPLVGAVVPLIFTVQDSQPSENRYGPNPKLDRPAPPRVNPVADPVAVCPACGSPTQGTKFCLNCGQSMRPRNECSRCGAQFQPGTKFCPECGTKAG